MVNPVQKTRETGFVIRNLSLRTRVVPAPLSGFSDRVFRDIARAFGCHLVFTEMISAEGLARNNRQTWNLLDTEGEEFPIGIQLFGQREEALAEAARLLVDRGAALIDLNLGCPVRKVVRSGAGASLLEEPTRIINIVRSLRKAVSLPLTVKMRSGTRGNPMAAIEIAPKLEQEGVDAICLHPRTQEMAFSGLADWNLIGELKQCVSLPVIGNGDIRSGDDARRMMEQTGCDAVMIGRGAIGNPWLFRQARAALGEIPHEMNDTPTLDEVIQHTISHVEKMVERKGERKGIKEFRKHGISYLKRCPLARKNRAIFFELNNLDAIKEYLTAMTNS